MQVSVETTQGLERKLTVQVPVERVNEALDQRFQQIARSAKIPGFRPGKVPLNVVKKQYAAEARQDVTSDLIQSTLGEAMSQQDVNPAGYPQIEKADLNDESGLSYTAVFEVYPEIEKIEVSGIAVERSKTEIADSDVDTMVETLRRQKAEWTDVERASKEEDQVTIDFQGKIDGEAFDGGRGENMPLVLGSNQMIPGFEDQIAGMSAGDEKTIDVTFPEDYAKDDLQGKAAQFDITVHKVAEQSLPEVDAEFAKAFGVEDGDVDQLRKNLQDHMSRELEQTLKNDIKKQVMDGLVAANAVDVPSALVEQEVGRLKEQAFQQFGGQAPIKLEELPSEPFQEEAQRRVQLGLLVGEVIKQNDIKADDAKVQEMIESIAASYEDPEEVKTYYNGNAQAKGQIEAVVIEDQAVEWILDNANVTDVEKSFADVMKLNQ